MLQLLLFVFLLPIRFIALLFRSKASLCIEILSLRQQLAITARPHKKRFVFSCGDRVVFSLFSQLSSRWKEFLLIVSPDTVIRWQNRWYTFLWRWKSRTPGRPPIPLDIRTLIKQMHTENPSWGALRIFGELMLLGYAGKVGLSSVKNYLALFGPRKHHNNSGQRWFTFIRNHIDVTSAVDFFTVILGNFKTLYCFVVLSHDRRKILHVNVTEHPDQQWVIQQMREAFPYATLPRYLIHDNDPMFNVSLKEYLKRLGTRPVATSVRSPWQNAYCERVIGTIRRECTDHFIFFSENHVRKVLREYVEYYNNVRPHSSLDAQTPSATRKVQPVNVGKVVAFPVLNGLHHEYRRIAA